MPGAELFPDPAQLAVRSFKITLPPDALNSLRRDARKDVPALVEENGQTWRDVAIHVKGAAGSSRGIDDKAALTLHFGKLAPGQRIYGLRKIHLNNSVQDPSYMCEHLCGEIFRRAGVPATRVAHAWVEINGKSRGLYVIKEGWTKDFLSLHFTNTTGNLYDGGFLREITDKLERDGGDGPADWADLRSLSTAAQEPDPARRWERLRATLDVERFAAYLAVENMTWDWDGYPMNRNNYRVYHDMDRDRMVFFPHGMDQMFWNSDGPWIGGFNGLLASAFMQTAEGKKLYAERYREIFTNAFQLEFLTNRVQQLGSVVKSALASRDKRAADEYQGQIERMKNLVIARHRSLERQLGQPPAAALKFTNGVARLAGPWREQNEAGAAVLDRPKDADGRATLHIRVQTQGAASWRQPVLLDAGTYRFEMAARTEKLLAWMGEGGVGAGIRISGARGLRKNYLGGDNGWTKLDYVFEVGPEPAETLLVCDARALKGDVWFDTESARLVKVK